MKNEIIDTAIAEVRKARHKISAEHGHDSKRLLDHYIQMQEEMKKSGKYRFISSVDELKKEN
jgi:hypothetical protein